jgi:hypothetical protein
VGTLTSVKNLGSGLFFTPIHCVSYRFVIKYPTMHLFKNNDLNQKESPVMHSGFSDDDKRLATLDTEIKHVLVLFADQISHSRYPHVPSSFRSVFNANDHTIQIDG